MKPVKSNSPFLRLPDAYFVPKAWISRIMCQAGITVVRHDGDNRPYPMAIEKCFHPRPFRSVHDGRSVVEAHEIARGHQSPEYKWKLRCCSPQADISIFLDEALQECKVVMERIF